MKRDLEEDLCLLGHAPCGSLSPRSVFSKTGYSLLSLLCAQRVSCIIFNFHIICVRNVLASPFHRWGN